MLFELFEDLRKQFSLQVAILIFFIYLVINTDTFMEQVLYKFDGAVTANELTSKGIVINGIIIVMAYIAFQILFYDRQIKN